LNAYLQFATAFKPEEVAVFYFFHSTVGSKPPSEVFVAELCNVLLIALGGKKLKIGDQLPVYIRVTNCTRL
jgi:hypothetical protein